MLNERRFSLRLLLAFSGIAAVSLGSSLYANWLTYEIEGETQGQLTNALPSVEHLTAAVDGLRDLESVSDEYGSVPLEERARARARLDELWRSVDAELSAYRDLPT